MSVPVWCWWRGTPSTANACRSLVTMASCSWATRGRSAAPGGSLAPGWRADTARLGQYGGTIGRRRLVRRRARPARHGESDWAPDADYSLEAFGRDLVTIVDTFTTPPHVVGASPRRHHRVADTGRGCRPLFASLTLVDIAPRMEADGVDRIIAFMRAHMDGFLDLEAPPMPSLHTSRTPAPQRPQRPQQEPAPRAGRPLPVALDPEFRVRHQTAYRLPTTRPPPRAARRLTLPTLLVRGRMSDVISDAGRANFSRRCPTPTTWTCPTPGTWLRATATTPSPARWWSSCAARGPSPDEGRSSAARGRRAGERRSVHPAKVHR